MQRAVSIALVCAIVTTARADDPPPSKTYAMFSLPLLLGGTSRGDDGFLIGIRPELVIARLAARADDDEVKAGHGIGVYGELLRANGSMLTGGGLTYVPYRASGFTVAPSLGLYHRYTGTLIPDNGVTASLFLGWRRQIAGITVLDFPFGIRVEGRFGYDGDQERSIVIAAQLDLMFPIMIIGSLSEAKNTGSVFPLPR
jgi:hypothetical protein